MTPRNPLPELDPILETFRLANDLAGRFDLQEILERILRHALESLDCDSGSISTVDEELGTYAKAVDIGISCQSGRTFPLDEGVTGEVMRAGGSVVLADYTQVQGGHLHPSDRDAVFGVIASPIRWAGAVLGVCTVFSRDPDRRFTRDEVGFLELIAGHAAIALTNAHLHSLASERATSLAVTAERERLIRDVSDAASRELASLRIHLSTAERALTDPHAAHEAFARARSSVDRAIREVRRTAATPSSPVLSDRSLAEVLGLELIWIESRYKKRTDLIVSGQAYAFPLHVTDHLKKMVQQSLSNINAHAEASLIRIGLVYSETFLKIIIADDGCGFDPAAVPQRVAGGRGLGLNEIMARAESIGADVSIDTTLGWGTRIEFVVPRSDDEPREPQSRWRVIVCHGQPLARAGLSAMLSGAEQNVQVVGEVCNLTELGDAYRLLRPDVIVAGVPSPGTQLLEFVTEVRQIDPDAAVVLVADSLSPSQIKQATDLGVRGFVGRDIDPSGLVRAVIAATRGDSLMTHDLLRRLESDSMRTLESNLTAREREVRELVEQGLPDKQIARALGISVKTVEKHVGSMLRKTGARNRTMLAGLSGGV